MKPTTLSLAIVVWTIAFSVSADSLPLNPGLWESTTTNFNPMTGQRESESNIECKEENNFDPESMTEQGSGCEITRSVLDGDTLEFTMLCKMDIGEMTMNGIYTSDGDSADGTMEVEASFGGQVFNSIGTYSAKRIGDC